MCQETTTVDGNKLFEEFWEWSKDKPALEPADHIKLAQEFLKSKFPEVQGLDSAAYQLGQMHMRRSVFGKK